MTAKKPRKAGPEAQALDPFLPPLPEKTDDERAIERIEPAWAQCAFGFRTDWRFGHRGEMRVQSLVAVHEDLERRREAFEQGNTLALLHAVQLCGEENLPLPSWLALEFGRAFGSFVNTDGKAYRLDDVFRSPSLPVGKDSETSVAGRKQDAELGVQLYREVAAIASRHRGLSSALDEVLASRKWGVGKTKATALVKMIDEAQSTFTSGRVKPLSQIWLKARKQVR